MSESQSEHHIVIGRVKDGAALGAGCRFSFCCLHWKDSTIIINSLATTQCQAFMEVTWPLCSDSNFPKLTSTTLGFPGKISWSADPGQGEEKCWIRVWFLDENISNNDANFTFTGGWMWVCLFWNGFLRRWRRRDWGRQYGQVFWHHERWFRRKWWSCGLTSKHRNTSLVTKLLQTLQHSVKDETFKWTQFTWNVSWPRLQFHGRPSPRWCAARAVWAPALLFWIRLCFRKVQGLWPTVCVRRLAVCCRFHMWWKEGWAGWNKTAC